MSSVAASVGTEGGARVIDGLDQPARRWSMLVIILGLIVSVLDGTIVNLAPVSYTHLTLPTKA